MSTSMRGHHASVAAVLGAVACISLVAAAVALQGDQRERDTLMHGGLVREYFVHEPPDGLEDGAPLVIALHGLSSNAGDMHCCTGLTEQADRHGFAVAYVEGSPSPPPLRWQHWNANLAGSTGVDDVGFLSDLARHLQRRHGYDPERTYVFGLSNGGFMAYTLACEAPEVFAAVAVIMADMSPNDWRDCDPREPTPVLHIHGEDDYAVPIGGATAADGGRAPAVADVIDFWARINRTTETTTERLGTSTIAVRHTGGVDGNEVWYHRVEELGHEIPDPATGTDTAALVVDFFDLDERVRQ